MCVRVHVADLGYRAGFSRATMGRRMFVETRHAHRVSIANYKLEREHLQRVGVQEHPHCCPGARPNPLVFREQAHSNKTETTFVARCCPNMTREQFAVNVLFQLLRKLRWSERLHVCRHHSEQASGCCTCCFRMAPRDRVVQLQHDQVQGGKSLRTLHTGECIFMTQREPGEIER